MHTLTFNENTQIGHVATIELNKFGSWHVWHIILTDDSKLILREVDLADDSYYPE